jgi:hypothetical protein
MCISTKIIFFYNIIMNNLTDMYRYKTIPQLKLLIEHYELLIECDEYVEDYFDNDSNLKILMKELKKKKIILN